MSIDLDISAHSEFFAVCFGGLNGSFSYAFEFLHKRTLALGWLLIIANCSLFFGF